MKAAESGRRPSVHLCSLILNANKANHTAVVTDMFLC